MYIYLITMGYKNKTIVMQTRIIASELQNTNLVPVSDAH